MTRHVGSVTASSFYIQVSRFIQPLLSSLGPKRIEITFSHFLQSHSTRLLLLAAACGSISCTMARLQPSIHPHPTPASSARPVESRCGWCLWSNPVSGGERTQQAHTRAHAHTRAGVSVMPHMSTHIITSSLTDTHLMFLIHHASLHACSPRHAASAAPGGAPGSARSRPCRERCLPCMPTPL